MEHKTMDGSKMIISDMEDSHLDNTIKMILNNILELNNLYFNKQVEDINTLTSGYTKSNINKKDLVFRIQNQKERLSYYILEAVIRGKDYTEVLQKLFERKQKTNIVNTLMGNNLLGSDYTSRNTKIKEDVFDVDDIPF